MPSAPADLASKPGFTMFSVNADDASHHPIDGLKQTDFAAYANSTAFPIGFFHTDNGAAPESIALVIDTSGSMHPKLPIVEKALGDFLSKLYPCDEVAVYAFSDRPYLLQPFTTDHQAAAQKLGLLRANGETALYDSIATAIDYQQKSAHYPNRVILVITDGMDNKSRATESEVVAQSKSGGVQMFLVGIGDPNASANSPDLAMGPYFVGGTSIEHLDTNAINSFADATGGEAFIIPTMNDKDDSGAFGTAIASIGAALGHGYTLGIVLPPGIDAASVTVAIPTHPGAIVTTRAMAATQSSNPPIAIATPTPSAPLDLCSDPAISTAGQSTSVAAANQPRYTQLAISVTGASGKPVTGLRQSDFSVEDVPGQHLPIAYFTGKENNAPTSLVVVIDESGSMYGKLVAPNDMLAAIRSKISAVVGTLNRCDEVALVMASGALLNGDHSEMNQVRVLQPFTTDHALLFRHMYDYTASGQTSLYDAIEMGLQTAAGAHYRQRALLVITDGIDNTSTTRKNDLVAELRRSRVEFFVVGVGDPAVGSDSRPLAFGPFVMGGQPDLARMDAQNLSDLSASANGQFIEASAVTKDQGESFTQALQRVSDSLRSSYVIGVVVPPGTSASSVTVAVPSHPGAVVTTRAIPAAQSPEP
ncbi:MAG: VWA domain-containing protein [Candidatus Binataceae bacterium]